MINARARRAVHAASLRRGRFRSSRSWGSVVRGYSGGRHGPTRCEPRGCATRLLLRPKRPPSHPRASSPAGHAGGGVYAPDRAPSTSRCAFGSRHPFGVDRAHGPTALADRVPFGVRSHRRCDARPRVRPARYVARQEGVSVPRGGAFWRSKSLARNARLAACKPVRDDEWNARDRRPRRRSNVCRKQSRMTASAR